MSKQPNFWCPIAVMASLVEHDAEGFKAWKEDKRKAEAKAPTYKAIKNWMEGKHGIISQSVNQVAAALDIGKDELCEQAQSLRPSDACCKCETASSGKPCTRYLCPVATLSWLRAYDASKFSAWSAKQDPQRMYDWEAGTAWMSFQDAQELATVIGVAVEELLAQAQAGRPFIECCKHDEGSRGKPCAKYLRPVAALNWLRARDASGFAAWIAKQDPQRVHDWEAGTAWMSFQDAQDLAFTLGVAVEDLLAQAQTGQPFTECGKQGHDPTGKRCTKRDFEPDVIVIRGVKLVCIPGGSFQIGAPPEDKDERLDDARPPRDVELAPFYLAVTPVTVKQYREYLSSNPKAPKPLYWKDRIYNDDDQPVVGISWGEANAYCEWAGLVLPTEAQWEYACRARSTTRFWSGNTEQDLARIAWYNANSEDQLRKVAEKPANPFGLYDIHGNVEEWCADTRSVNYMNAVFGPDNGLRSDPRNFSELRITRGGSWKKGAMAACVYRRSSWRGTERSCQIGFRPAVMVPN